MPIASNIIVIISRLIANLSYCFAFKIRASQVLLKALIVLYVSNEEYDLSTAASDSVVHNVLARSYKER